jgi:IS5 family transposase
LVDDLVMAGLRKQIDHYRGLADRVIDRARRRVIEVDQLPNAEKIYSIFEPHTDLIKRGKVRSPMEFGHKVFLAESAKGPITQYQVLNGNPPDEQQLSGSLQRHKRSCSRTVQRRSRLERNLALCKGSGVKVVCIPQSGGRRTPQREAWEKTPTFKHGQRFRAGIEGRISVLFRGRGMARRSG